MGAGLDGERVGGGERVARHPLEDRAGRPERRTDRERCREPGPPGVDDDERVRVGAPAQEEAQQVAGVDGGRPLGEVDGGQPGQHERQRGHQGDGRGDAPSTPAGVGRPSRRDGGGHEVTAVTTSVIHCFAEAGPP